MLSQSAKKQSVPLSPMPLSTGKALRSQRIVEPDIPRDVNRSAARPQLRQDRFRRIADRLDRSISGIEKRHDPARTAFQSLVAPRKRTNQAALIEHQFNIAAEIFGMQ